ncbi:MAG: hypothetical protein ABH967_00310 [Patescibacteria group bacterium]
MNKKTLLSIVLLGIVMMPMIISAATLPTVSDNYGIESLVTKIESIGNLIFTALIVVATFFIIFAGWTYVTAGGDPTKIEGARTQIKNALIGIIIAMIAKGLVAVVRNFIGTSL